MLHPSAGQLVQEPLDLALQLDDGALACPELALAGSTIVEYRPPWWRT
jgi:hypothetical protein